MYFYANSYLLSDIRIILELLFYSFLSMYQRTPLHTAAVAGYRYTVVQLVGNGADTSLKDNEGVSLWDYTTLDLKYNYVYCVSNT